jgi:hypothetical protein
MYKVYEKGKVANSFVFAGLAVNVSALFADVT